MKEHKLDVIIIGGSFAGLSAAMALGRSIRHVLIIDSGTPCNRQTPYAHNFITHDGEPPASIAAAAKAQVLLYPTVSFTEGKATNASRLGADFVIDTEDGRSFTSKKILLATGLTDIMPDIEGFKECWGISVLHCPYCHGYEVRNKHTGILGNSETTYDYACLISNWTKDLTIYTNGPCEMTHEQLEKLRERNIHVVEKEITAIDHKHGSIRHIIFQDGSQASVSALYHRALHIHQSDIAEQLGCHFTQHKLIEVDMFNHTSVHGVYAAGDNSSAGRSIAVAIAHGSVAGTMLNKELTEESFVY